MYQHLIHLVCSDNDLKEIQILHQVHIITLCRKYTDISTPMDLYLHLSRLIIHPEGQTTSAHYS